MRKFILFFIFFFISFQGIAQKVTDTFKLYFDLNVAELNKNTQKKIDLLIYNDRIINGSSITIIGYADYLGTNPYNQKLSMKRAMNVEKYLLKNNIDTSNIKICIGKGQVTRKDYYDKSGYPIDRRVDLVVNTKVIKEKPPKPKKDTPVKKKPIIDKDITHINELKKGETIQLNNVYFPPGRHTVVASSLQTLNKLYEVMRDNPKLKISIEGHVCCITDAFDAMDIETGELSLSVNRAREIYNFLIQKGIDAGRLKYVGFGKSRPIVAYERNEEDAERNRRVEVRVIDN